jgi:hypothetical protein
MRLKFGPEKDIILEIFARQIRGFGVLKSSPNRILSPWDLMVE